MKTTLPELTTDERELLESLSREDYMIDESDRPDFDSLRYKGYIYTAEQRAVGYRLTVEAKNMLFAEGQL